MAPAVIASSSLMPSHSIDHLLYRKFDSVSLQVIKGEETYLGWENLSNAPLWRHFQSITKKEFDWNLKRPYVGIIYGRAYSPTANRESEITYYFNNARTS